MTTKATNTTTQWKTTIIVSKSLQSHDTSRTLLQQHRVRFSAAVESGSFVFPQSGIAFLLMNPQDLSDNFGEAEVYFDKIKKFVTVHRNSFLLLQALCFGKKELDILSMIQFRFLGSNLRVLPVHNNAEVVKGMLTIAKATSKPHVDSLRDRMSQARAQILESSPVWEMLQDITLG